LRLFRRSANQDAHRQLLHKPLRWLEANIADDGHIPCWFTRGVEDLSAEAPVLWGNRCLTVEANLLLGLIDYDRVTYAALIERAARRWLEHWQTSGLGANTLYTSEYALWRVAELLAALPKDAQAAERLSYTVQAQAKAVTTPQGAAFLTLICLSPNASTDLRALFAPRWIDLILKPQRYDGSWAGEPLFITPTRGDVAAWYSSHSVTTAYCYHALKTFVQTPLLGQSSGH